MACCLPRFSNDGPHHPGNGGPYSAEEVDIMRKLLTGLLGLTTLAALLVATPEAEAQKRGGGGGGGGSRSNAGRVYSSPSYGGEWRGSEWRGSGWGWAPYGSYGYGGYYGDRYRYGAYPRTYGYYDYPEYYDTYPATTQDYSYYPPETVTPSTAQIRILVPDPNARIWFNGAPTNQRGTNRVFTTPPLNDGYTHTYEIHARWMNADGQAMDQTRNVEVQPGQAVNVNFN